RSPRLQNARDHAKVVGHHQNTDHHERGTRDSRDPVHLSLDRAECPEEPFDRDRSNEKGNREAERIAAEQDDATRETVLRRGICKDAPENGANARRPPGAERNAHYERPEVAQWLVRQMNSALASEGV